ncbi:MAG: hypothetical protein KDA88_05230 [Planctomycetaceae bacterium]|nr:hypothetical protein [Planctomycetaceae bacterium]MCB9949704.1 hypothetical protein [Planctomycetaceae bacterium]
MLNALWQLTRVTLRTDARSLNPHLTRVGLASLLLLVIAFMRSWPRGALVTAPGLDLFRAQLAMTHLFLTANTLFGFSLIIQEEREAGTLELLRLAGFNSLSVLLGKLMPRFIDSLLLLSVQIPFTLLEVTLGGITMNQVIAAYVVLFTYLWLMAMIGVWFSVWCTGQRSAVTWTALAVAAYNFPYLGSWMGGLLALGLPNWDQICLPLRLVTITEPGFIESPWNYSILTLFLVGLFIGLASWWQLQWSLSVPTVAASQSKKRQSQRVWRRPLIWKEVRFLMGGWKGLVIRTFIYVALFTWMALTMLTAWHWGFVFAWSSLLGGGISLIDGTWTASRLFRDEKENQTWSVLALTPKSSFELSLEKWTGWLIGHAPSLLLPYFFLFVCPFIHESIDDLGKTTELYIGSIATGLAIIASLHLLAINSLAWGWKAIPLTFTICCLGGYVFVAHMFPWGYQIGERNIVHAAVAFFLLILIVAMQARLAHLLDKHAGADS